MLQIFCHLWDSLSRLQFLSLIQKCFHMRDFIFPSLIQHSLKIENLQHFPALQQPTDLPTVPSRVTQRFLPQTHNSFLENMSQLNKDICLIPCKKSQLVSAPSAFKFPFVARPTKLLSSLPLFRPTGRPGLIGDAEQAEQVWNLN